MQVKTAGEIIYLMKRLKLDQWYRAMVEPVASSGYVYQPPPFMAGFGVCFCLVVTCFLLFVVLID